MRVTRSHIKRGIGGQVSTPFDSHPPCLARQRRLGIPGSSGQEPRVRQCRGRRAAKPQVHKKGRKRVDSSQHWGRLRSCGEPIRGSSRNLDLNHYIQLAKASRAGAGHTTGTGKAITVLPGYEALLDSARRAELERRAIFPLSSVHFMEVAHAVPSPRQRGHVTDTMEELSDFAYLLGRPSLVQLEITAGLDKLYGTAASYASVPLLQNSALWAFGRNSGFRFVNERTGEDLEPQLRKELGDEAFEKQLAEMNYRRERSSSKDRRMRRSLSYAGVDTLLRDTRSAPRADLTSSSKPLPSSTTIPRGGAAACETSSSDARSPMNRCDRLSCTCNSASKTALDTMTPRTWWHSGFLRLPLGIRSADGRGQRSAAGTAAQVPFPLLSLRVDDEPASTSATRTALRSTPILRLMARIETPARARRTASAFSSRQSPGRRLGTLRRRRWENTVARWMPYRSARDLTLTPAR